MNTLDGHPLYDPRDVRENRARFRRDAVPALARANSFCCPTGRWPSAGWVLMLRDDYDLVSKLSTSLQLEVGDPRNPDNVGTIKGLSIVQARCVTTGLASDSSALYLVELTDARALAMNRWFQFPLTTSYNVRSPGYAGGYYTDTLDDGVPWTWDDMLGDIWGKIEAGIAGSVLGAWPGLPDDPDGTPEGFWFAGVSAWSAICDVLDALGMTVACDPTSTTPFSIVSTGEGDADFDAQQERYLLKKEDDMEWIDFGAARAPASVTVLFRRRNASYGTEETVRLNALQWSTHAIYSVSVSAPAFFAGTCGKHYLWSDFTVRYDQDGSPVAADVTTAATIAAERVSQYYDRIYSRTSGFMTQVYAGALPFTTGSQVDGVRWYQDYKDVDRHGWKTEIVRGMSPPWPALWDSWPC